MKYNLHTLLAHFGLSLLIVSIYLFLFHPSQYFFCLCLLMTTRSFTSLFHTLILFCTFLSFCLYLNQSVPQIINFSFLLLFISSSLSFFFHIPRVEENNFCILVWLLCGNIVFHHVFLLVLGLRPFSFGIIGFRM